MIDLETENFKKSTKELIDAIELKSKIKDKLPFKEADISRLDVFRNELNKEPEAYAKDVEMLLKELNNDDYHELSKNEEVLINLIPKNHKLASFIEEYLYQLGLLRLHFKYGNMVIYGDPKYNPTIIKKNQAYYIYPNTFSASIHEGKLRVNDVDCKEYIYGWKPQKKGEHMLDLSYVRINYYGDLDTIENQVRLMVN